MFHISQNTINLHFDDFMIHTLSTIDKVLQYGENSQIDFSKHPTVVQRGEERIINIYAAVSDVA